MSPGDSGLSDDVGTLEHLTQNVFLIDWLTVVFKNQSVLGVQALLGLPANIQWQEQRKFVYGYPVTTHWNNINIRWGADNEEFYSTDDVKSASEKVNLDMGVCLEMSGQGCRAFEQYGHGDWLKLFQTISELEGDISITRLDIAYDDHIGLLDINRIRMDVEDRNVVCKSRKTAVHWSDDWDEDIQGLTVEVGSRKSLVLVRIYNKAAERGFDHTKHWIRVEIQLRKERAKVAFLEILKEQHIGFTASGILRNYCTFRTPTADSNKCRWPIADYWENLLLNMDKIRIVLAPGEPYNYSKTEAHLKIQYGQAIITYFRMHGEIKSLLDACIAQYPNLKPKYENAITDFKVLEAEYKRLQEESMYELPIFEIEDDDPMCQVDFDEMFAGF